jgi:hypothetical protein
MLRSAVWMLMWMDVEKGRNKQQRREISFVDAMSWREEVASVGCPGSSKLVHEESEATQLSGATDLNSTYQQQLKFDNRILPLRRCTEEL